MRLKVNALVPAVREQVCDHPAFMYTGRVPCTGALRCYMCGATKEEAEAEGT